MTNASQPSDAIISDLARDADLADIIEEFVGALPERIAAITRALEDHDITTLRQLAHQMKGAAAGYGFPEITEAAGRLERCVQSQPGTRDDDLEKVRREADALATLCGRARVS